MNTEKSTILQQSLNWSTIDWKNIESYVTKLQQQIFLAEINNQKRKVKQLQRRLIHSKANLLLAIKNVTLRRSADTDNCKVSNNEKIQLYYTLLKYNFHNIKPLNLNNSNTIKDKNIIKDKIIQTIIKSALEPQWETRFEPNSYGGRPGRSIYDAIGSIYNKTGANKKRQWCLIIDLNVNNCNVDYLAKQLDDFAYKDTIVKWLNANYIQYANNPIRSLLVNILLTGIEQHLGVRYNKRNIQVSSGPSIVRFNTKLVIFCTTEKEALTTLDNLKTYIDARNVIIKTHKIVHLTTGFDFLGFNIRTYQATKNNNHKYKLLIKPSKSSIQAVVNQIKNVFDKYKGHPVKRLIELTNPIVCAAAFHWRTVVASPAYKYIDNYVDYKFYHHIKRLHPRKSWKWIKQQYYKVNKSGSLGKHICDPKAPNIVRFYCRDVGIKRHKLVTFNNSPYNPQLIDYWDNHYKHIFCTFHGNARIKMALRQKFICPHCLRKLYGQELLEMNHIMPTKFDGMTKLSNIQLMHTSCYIEHHKLFKTKDDFIQYQQAQKQWYDQLWEKK